MEEFLARLEEIQNSPESGNLEFAQQCISYFAQENVTGPSLDLPDLYEDLSLQGEEVVPLVVGHRLLSTALYLLQNPQTPEDTLWRTRALLLHQKILANHVDSLRTEILELVDSLVIDGTPEVLIESAQIYVYFNKINKAKEALGRAQEALQVSWELTGKLGRRTKYQQEAKPILVLNVEDQSAQSKQEEASTVPVNVPLDEEFEYIHEKPVLEEEPSSITELNAVQKSYLLAELAVKRSSSAVDDQQKEEVAAFLENLLDKSIDWLIFSQALLLRSKNQSESFKFRERSVIQIQALADQYKDVDPPAAERYTSYFLLNYPIRYQLYKDLGDMYIGLGVALSAYGIFKNLGMREDAVECLIIAGNTQKAERLARKIVPPTPRVLCQLGEITKDETFYWQAWEVSGMRYTKAKRILAYNAYTEGDYNASIDHYKEALEINPLFENAWFTMGCALMRTERWQEASQAFIRVNGITNESSDALNNLAACYLRLEKYEQALLAMEKALKIARESWRMWENYLCLSVQLEDFPKTLMAMRTLIGMKKFDLFKAPVFRALNDYGRTEGNFEKVKWVYDQMANTTSMSAETWTLYGDFLEGKVPVADLAQTRLKACRSIMKIGWEQDPAICEELVSPLTILAITALNLETEKEQFEMQMFVNNTKKKIENRMGRSINFE